jgi:hypothetical protein
LRITTLVAASLAAGLVFMLAGDDEPVSEKETSKTSTAERSRQAGRVPAEPSYPNGYRRGGHQGPVVSRDTPRRDAAGSIQSGTSPFPVRNNYRFRPPDDGGSAAKRRQFHYSPLPAEKYAPYGGPEYELRSDGGDGRVNAPYGMPYRFRPLAEGRAETRYQPYTPPAREPYAPPESLPYQHHDNAAGHGMVDVPGGGSYRFRPLDAEKQSKRWRGSYRRMSTSPAQLASPYGAVRSAPNPS